MTVYKAAGKSVYSIKIPSRTRAEPAIRTTSTTNKRLANAMDVMISHLGPAGSRAWDLLDRVTLNELTVPKLYDAYAKANRDVEQTRVLLNQLDLAGLLPAYKDFCQSTLRKISDDTRRRYIATAEDFIGTTLLPDDCTPVYCRIWLAKIATGREPGTIRKWAQGARDFCTYAQEQGALRDNPWISVQLPPPATPRIHYLDDPQRDLFLNAIPEGPHRMLAALSLGTSADLSPALQVTPRDFDMKRQAVRIKGTKTHNRDRVCLVDRWAWPFLEPALQDADPDSRLFAVTDRWRARDAHSAACDALVLQGHTWAKDYWFRDHRHTWAVRAVRAGMPLELVARQLGHVNALLVLKVYGRFIPTTEEMDSWRDKIETAAKRRHPPKRKRT